MNQDTLEKITRMERTTEMNIGSGHYARIHILNDKGEVRERVVYDGGWNASVIFYVNHNSYTTEYQKSDGFYTGRSFEELIDAIYSDWEKLNA